MILLFQVLPRFHESNKYCYYKDVILCANFEFGSLALIVKKTPGIINVKHGKAYQ